jgi:hypothetical protein
MEAEGSSEMFISVYQTTRCHIPEDQNLDIAVRTYAFVAAVTFLPSHCLATIGGYTYWHKDWGEEFMKYAIEIGSGATKYIPGFIKIGSGIQKLMHRHTDSIVISWVYFYFFKIRKVGRKCNMKRKRIFITDWKFIFDTQVKNLYIDNEKESCNRHITLRTRQKQS